MNKNVKWNRKKTYWLISLITFLLTSVLWFTDLEKLFWIFFFLNWIFLSLYLDTESNDGKMDVSHLEATGKEYEGLSDVPTGNEEG